jgi:hypothetical protein
VAYIMDVAIILKQDFWPIVAIILKQREYYFISSLQPFGPISPSKRKFSLLMAGSVLRRSGASSQSVAGGGVVNVHCAVYIPEASPLVLDAAVRSLGFRVCRMVSL